MRYITIILLMLFSFSTTAQSSNAKDYINRYKSIALQQMIKTDIPASITLAQGILESSIGTSTLAVQANNHFVLSCTNDWNREVLYKLKDGNPNCFKIYDSPEESYIDHTRWLSNDAEFENLFYIEPTNYKRWAKGLEALRYKDYEDYADQLIQVIELYKLYNIDQEIGKYQDEAVVKAGEDEPIYLPNEDIYYNNGVKAVIANEEETPLEFAARMRIPLRKVLKYNDIKLADGFQPGQFVYLNSKKKKFKGEKVIHQVVSKDNIYLISQQYGIQLDRLLKLNHLEKGEEPRIGEKIYLKKRNPNKPFLRLDDFIPNTIPRVIPKVIPRANTKVNTKETEPPIIITRPPYSRPTHKPEIQRNNGRVSNNNNGSTIPDAGDGTTVPPKQKRETIYVYPANPNYEELQPPIINVRENSNKPENGKVINAENEIPTMTPPSKPIRENRPIPPNIHVVKKGETLYSISKQREITVQRLKDLNGLLGNIIEINQWLLFK